MLVQKPCNRDPKGFTLPKCNMKDALLYIETNRSRYCKCRVDVPSDHLRSEGFLRSCMLKSAPKSSFVASDIWMHPATHRNEARDLGIDLFYLSFGAGSSCPTPLESYSRHCERLDMDRYDPRAGPGSAVLSIRLAVFTVSPKSL